ASGIEQPAQALDHLVHALRRHHPGIDGLASGRLLGELRHIHVAIDGQGEGARDRRRGHYEQIGILRLGLQSEALMDAETMLLVDDDEAEVVEFDLVLEQSMGADENIDLAGTQRREQIAAGASFLAAGEEAEAKTGLLAQGAERGEMLTR